MQTPAFSPTELHRRRPWRLFALACFGLLWFGAQAFTQAPSLFQQFTARTNGEVILWEVVDWDQDGAQELVLVVEKASVRVNGKTKRLNKALLIYDLPDKAQTLIDPTEAFKIAETVTAVSLGQPAAGLPYELYCFDNKSVFTLHSGKNKPKRLLYEAPSFFDRPSHKDLVRYSGLYDLNADGLLDIVYPVGQGYALLLQNADQTSTYTLHQTLELLHPSKMHSFWGTVIDYSSSLPVLQQEDINNDGRLDLISLGSDAPLLFLLQEDGSFKTWNPPKANNIVDKKEIKINVFQLADLNADGNNDMISTMIFGDFGVLESLKTRVRIKYGQPNKNLLTLPYTESLLRKGVSAIPTLEDVNHDGKPDLLLSSVRTDLLANAVAYFKDTIDVHYYLFLFDEEVGAYPTKYNYHREVKLALGDITAEKTVPGLWMAHDVDANGISDLVHYNHEGKLFIYQGQDKNEQDFKKKATWTFRVQPKNNIDADHIWVHFVSLRHRDGNEIMVHDAKNGDVHLITRRP